MANPLLLLVSGPPGAGKTTLGKKIAYDLKMPFFNKDGIKETLFDTLGWRDREWSRQLGIASTRLLFHCIERQLEAGRSVVAESTFQATYDAPRLPALQERFHCQVLEVHCTAATDVLLARFLERAQSSQRHPGHGEQAQLEELRANLLGGVYHPLSRDGAALFVDTTDLMQLDYQGLLQTIRSAISAAG
ncbi:MAG TPA: AAA family ATPase [Ktedonobacterales bacterium]